MANETLGPLQLIDLELPALNDAFQQLVDRVDELKGLRGDATFLGMKTLVGVALRVTDSSGHLVHAFGTKT